MMRSANLFILTLLFCFSKGIELVLQHNNPIIMNSSLVRDTLSVSISSTGKAPSSFHLTSPLLPSEQMHQFTLAEKQINIEPQVDEEKLLINDFDGSEYWLTIKHNMVEALQKEEKINFVAALIEDGQNEYFYLLPAFAQPVTFFSSKKLYRCGNNLVAVTKSDKVIDFSVFSDGEPEEWSVVGEWDWTWKAIRKQTEFGRFLSNNGEKIKEISINIGNQRKCLIDLSGYETLNIEIPRKGYYKISDLTPHITDSQASSKTQSEGQL